jgi:ATP-dependent RNA circularization protein (DNA/RNA ligase family)
VGLEVFDMNQKKKARVFPIEEKLEAIKWNLRLLKTSAETTRTPLRTLKSMVQFSVVAPTQSSLQEIVNSHFR